MKKGTPRLILALLLIAPLLATAALADDTQGKALYDKKCAMCHGKDGVAKKMGAGSANFNDAAWLESTALDDVIAVTTNGRNKMPKYVDKLSADEIKLIATYVLSFPPAEPAASE